MNGVCPGTEYQINGDFSLDLILPAYAKTMPKNGFCHWTIHNVRGQTVVISVKLYQKKVNTK